MRIYVSGTIASPVTRRGILGEKVGPSMHHLEDEEKRQLFFDAAEMLIRRGHHPVLPMDVSACDSPGKCGEPVVPDDPASHSWECYLKYDLAEMFKCDGVLALPGWIYSKGAKLEINVAKALLIPLWEWHGILHFTKPVNTDKEI